MKIFYCLWQLLDAAEECRHKSLDLAKELLSAAFGRPLPEPGKVVQVRTLVRKQVNLAFLYTLLKSPGSIFVSVNFDSVIVYMKDIQFILVSLVSVFPFPNFLVDFRMRTGTRGRFCYPDQRISV